MNKSIYLYTDFNPTNQSFAINGEPYQILVNICFSIYHGMIFSIYSMRNSTATLYHEINGHSKFLPAIKLVLKAS